MTKRSLREIERQRRLEEADARRFIKQHELGSLPGVRSETGESSGRQQVGHGSNPTGTGATLSEGELPRKHREPLSYDSMGGLAQYEDWLVENHEQYLPLVGASAPPPDYEDLDRRARMNHCMSYLTEGQRRDLERHVLEQMTLQQIADEDSISRQAVHKRVAKAKAAFLKAYEEHWADDLPVADW